MWSGPDGGIYIAQWLEHLSKVGLVLMVDIAQWVERLSKVV